MATVSLCMIVKNEERCLRRCLSSAAAICDEIVVVDTGSSDSTKEIAAEFSNKIFDFCWVDDFSAARNFAFSKANSDYILWLDADDVILPQDAELFLELKARLASEPDIDAVMLRYDTAFDGSGRPVFSCFRERLVRRAAGFLWREPVHEYLEISGKIINGQPAICHFPPPREGRGERNLKIYKQILDGGGTLSPRGVYYYARELFDHGRFAAAVDYFMLFLDSSLGWVEDNIGACGRLAECYDRLGQPQKVVSSLLRSLQYDLPRAEVCCQLGYFYKKSGQIRQAIYWFKQAIAAEKNKGGWGFVQEDYYGYVPHLELAVLYFSLGQVQKARLHNDAALQIKPESAQAAHNLAFFESLSKSEDLSKETQADSPE